MTESPMVNEWQERGRLEEQLNNTKQLLLEFLETRFPEVIAAPERQLIEQQDSPELLRHWYSAAIRAATAADILTELRR